MSGSLGDVYQISFWVQTRMFESDYKSVRNDDRASVACLVLLPEASVEVRFVPQATTSDADTCRYRITLSVAEQPFLFATSYTQMGIRARHYRQFQTSSKPGLLPTPKLSPRRDKCRLSMLKAKRDPHPCPTTPPPPL